MTVMYFVFERRDLPEAIACAIRMNTAAWPGLKSPLDIARNVTARAQSALAPGGNAFTPVRVMRCVHGYVDDFAPTRPSTTISADTIWEWAKDLTGQHLYGNLDLPVETDSKGRAIGWYNIMRRRDPGHKVGHALGAVLNMIRETLRRAGVPHEGV